MNTHHYITFLIIAILSNIFLVCNLYRKTVVNEFRDRHVPTDTSCKALLNGKTALTGCKWHIYRKNETVSCFRQIEQGSSSHDIWAEKVPPMIRIFGGVKESTDFFDDFAEVLDLAVSGREITKFGFKISVVTFDGIDSIESLEEPDAHWLNIIVLPVSKEFRARILSKILENPDVSYIFVNQNSVEKKSEFRDFQKITKQLPNVFHMTQNQQDIDELRTRFFNAEIPSDRNVFLNDVSLTVNSILNFKCNRIIRPGGATCCMDATDF